MKRFLLCVVVFFGLAILLWIFLPAGSPTLISAQVLGRTNHPYGGLRYCVAITNVGKERLQGMIEGEMMQGQTWTTNRPGTTRHFYHFNFRPGEGGWFGCVVETNRTPQILVTYSVDTEFTAMVRKLRELRKFQPKTPKDFIPNAHSLWLEIPPP